jgi:hypothetical protein
MKFFLRFWLPHVVRLGEHFGQLPFVVWGIIFGFQYLPHVVPQGDFF